MGSKAYKQKGARLVVTVIASILVTLLSTYSALVSSNTVSAANAKNFDPENIIDNAVFRNNKSMSASQIQSFLNTKNSVCLKNYKGLALVDTNGNGQVEDWTKAEQYGGKTGKAKMSAAELIKAASDIYKINPQVLLVTLQKEQSLITGTNCANIGTAFGYGCPDTAACDPAAMGFTRQVDNAAYHFKGYYQNSLTYVPYTKGKYTVNYNPKASCGGTKLTIQNEATASLYSYTPYQPNKAALNAGYGTGDTCSSYGNRNFFLYFTDWFGSTHYTVRGGIAAKYNQSGGIDGWLGLPLMNEKCGLAKAGCYQKFENGSIYWTSATDAHIVHGGIRTRWASIGAENSRLGYPVGEEQSLSTGGVYQNYQKGRVYWSSPTDAWDVAGGIGEKYQKLSADNSFLGYPITGEVAGTGGVYQGFQNGRIYWSSKTDAWEIHGGIEKRYKAIGAEKSLGYPKSTEITADNGVYQEFQNGRIYWSSPTAAWDVRGGIQKRYKALGAEKSSLGYPTSGEIGSSGGVYQNYQKGRVYWSSPTDAWNTSDAILAHYKTLDENKGFLGYPTSSPIVIEGGLYQKFKNGRIYWSEATNAHNVHGGIQATYTSLGAERSRLGFPTSNEIPNSGGVYQSFQGGTIEWSRKTGKTKVTYS